MNFLHIGLSTGDNGHAEGFRQVFSNYRDINVSSPTLNSDIEAIAASYKPDLVFIQIQDAGISDSALQALKSNGAWILNWCGDVRARTPQCYFDYARNVDLTCFSNLRDIDNMRQTGFKSDWLQIGYDPSIYRPDPVVEKDIDIIFMGNSFSHFPLSGLRREMVKELKRVYGDRFKAFGSGMPDGSYMGNQPGEAAMYRRAKIGINLSHFDLPRYTSDRMFRMLGCGVCVLSHNYHDIKSDFIESQVLTWNNLSDLVRHIDFVLNNPTTLNGIAQNGHQLAVNNHTFSHMAQNVLKLYENNK